MTFIASKTVLRLFIGGIIILVLLGATLFISIFVFGVQNELVRKERMWKEEVEVSPTNFILVHKYLVEWTPRFNSFGAVHIMPPEEAKFYQHDFVIVEIPWKSDNLRWAGFGYPLSIRSHEEKLYLIVLDKTDYQRNRFRFFAQSHGGFSEIPAKDYPKEIATQNLCLNKKEGFRNDGTVINPIEIAIKLDVADSCFQASYTAMIWYQLETGKEYFEIQKTTAFIDERFLQEFLKEHNVERLTQIAK